LPQSDVIDYYFAPMSGYAYLGHARLLEMAKQHGVELRYHPLNMLKVFAAAGSFPPAKYPDVRQHHRKADMARWAAKLDLPINTTPAFWPVAMDLACRVIVAAKSLNMDQGAVTGAILSAVWAENRNIADADDLSAMLSQWGLDGEALLDEAQSPDSEKDAELETQRAIDLGIFGSPTYVLGDAWYFGQDRLGFLASELARERS